MAGRIPASQTNDMAICNERESIMLSSGDVATILSRKCTEDQPVPPLVFSTTPQKVRNSASDQAYRTIFGIETNPYMYRIMKTSEEGSHLRMPATPSFHTELEIPLLQRKRSLFPYSPKISKNHFVINSMSGEEHWSSSNQRSVVVYSM